MVQKTPLTTMAALVLFGDIARGEVSTERGLAHQLLLDWNIFLIVYFHDYSAGQVSVMNPRKSLYTRARWPGSN